MKIQRLEFYVEDDGDRDPFAVPHNDPTGDYVLYTDLLAVMQRELECREKLVEALDKAMKHFDCGPTCSVPCDNNCCTANIGRAALAAAKEMNDKHLTLESLSAGIVRKIIALRKELGE